MMLGWVNGASRERIQARSAALAALSILIGIALVPWAPPFRPDYCEQQLHWAFAKHWRYGSDIAFHSGPLGFLGSPLYDPSTYPALLVAHLLAVALTAYVLREMSRWVFGEFGNEWLHVAAILLPLCLTPVSYYSALLTLPLVLMFALLLLQFAAPNRWEGIAKYVVIAALGLSVLIKSSLGLPLFAGMLCISADEMRCRRRLPLSLLVFLASLSAGWVIGRQELSAVGVYLHFTREFVAGYRDASSLWSLWSSALALLVGAALLLATAALYDNARQRIGRAAAMSVVAVWCLIVYGLFLHGFVRADREHTIHETLALLAVAAVAGPWLVGTQRPTFVQKATRICFATAFAFSFVEALAGHVGFGRLLFTGPRELVTLLRNGPWGLRARYHSELARLQGEGAPLALHRPADMAAGTPVNPGILLLTPGFRPRPTVVSYAATTPDLIDLNRNYLERSDGPANVLFQPYAIDGLYPTLSDSTSLLSLATHYRLLPSSAAGQLRPDSLPLIFERRARPAHARLSVVRRQSVRLGETVDLRGITGAPIWLSITLHPNLTGTAFALAFKPLPVAIEAVVKGTRIRKRLATKLAAAGMLLSPYLETAEDFRAFYTAPASGVQFNAVEQISIPTDADPPFSARIWLQNRVDIVLQTVTVEP